MIFFFKDTATTEIYTRSIVGSVRCVQETDISLSDLLSLLPFIVFLFSSCHFIFSCLPFTQLFSFLLNHLPFFLSLFTLHILFYLSLIHISEPTRPLYISYAVFCLKKKKKQKLI
eukprot:TRINITY_DN54705_c0_g1_i1.p2 TRINITY_DN54705_c0_g1~~TRINITY_DN54705_c0_g1_i1.p2  ORF type:complete len:115 (+),score=27.45 TRINITY_DN54705_c0_g1_i1:56-400(+)